jgi:tetratricopeptide (TPR) repeat protein
MPSIKPIMAAWIILVSFWWIPAYGTQDENEQDSLEELYTRIEELRDESRFSEARPLAEKAVEMVQKTKGPVHPDLLDPLSMLSILNEALDNKAKADLLNRLIETIEMLESEKIVSGDSHPRVVRLIEDAARIYRELEEDGFAAALFSDALGRLKTSGIPEDLKTANVHDELGKIHITQGDFPTAGFHFQQSVAIREKMKPKWQPELAEALLNLGETYHRMGNIQQAEDLYQASLDICNYLPGKNGPRGNALNHLGLVRLAMGDNKRAGSYFNEARKQLKNVKGAVHPELAAAYYNQAVLYDREHKYKLAEDAYREAGKIWEKTPGIDFSRISGYWVDYALFKMERGDFVRAESMFAKALDIAAFPGKITDAQTYVILSGFLRFCKATGDYDQAISLFKKTLTDWENVFGPNHPRTTMLLLHFGNLLYHFGDSFQAGEVFRRTVEISESLHGPKHPIVAVYLANMAHHQQAAGNYTGTESSFKRALEIYRQVLGMEHPRVTRIMHSQALHFSKTGLYKTAYKLYQEAHRIDSKLIDLAGFCTSKQIKKEYFALKKRDRDHFLDFIVQHMAGDTSAIEEAMNICLNRKNMPANLQFDLRMKHVHMETPGKRKQLKNRIKLKNRLADLIFMPSGIHFPSTYRKNIDELKQKLIESANLLSPENHALLRTDVPVGVDFKKVAQALPDDAVMIDYIRINRTGSGRRQRNGYLAFVLNSSQKNQPAMVDLGDARAIEHAVMQYRKHLENQKNISAAGWDKPAKDIAGRIFLPLLPHIGDARHVIVSPDAALNLIPFEVLIDANENFLIENYTFTYFTSGKDLINVKKIDEMPSKILMMGMPDFNSRAYYKKKEKESKGSFLSDKTALPGIPYLLRNKRFARQMEIGDELDIIKILFRKENTAVFSGKHALEEIVVDQAKSYPVLHLAAPVFAMSGTNSVSLDENSYELSDLWMSPAYVFPLISRNFKTIDDPWLNSGIILAGANNAFKPESDHRLDGILNAEEIMVMHPGDTILTVLSTRDPGFDSYMSGDGIGTLRRAFTRGGNKHLVMSLWAMPENERIAWLVTFYSHMLSGRMTGPHALRYTALARLEACREKYGHNHPLVWGAFVYSGKP